MSRQNDIVAIMELLEAYWSQHPDLRLCQLIGNIFGADDHYYRHDHEVKQALTNMLKGEPPGVKQGRGIQKMQREIDHLRGENRLLKKMCSDDGKAKLYQACWGDPTCTNVVGIFSDYNVAKELAVIFAEDSRYFDSMTGEEEYEAWWAAVRIFELNRTYSSVLFIKDDIVWEAPEELD